MGNSASQKSKKEKPSSLQIRNTFQTENIESKVMIENDNFTKIKQSLKYLHKNNFTSLTFEDLNAYFIQISWKRHIINIKRENKMGIVDILYSSITKNTNSFFRQEKVFDVVESRRFPFRCYDLVNYVNLQKIVDQFGGYDDLPAIFINGYYIGTTKHLQEMDDLNLTSRIVSKEYEIRCLVCNVVRTSPGLENCPHCYKKYYFFAKSEKPFDVYQNRNNKNIIF